MTIYPVVPVVWLLVIGVFLLAIRMIALYRLLVRTASGNYRHVVTRWAGLTLAVILLLVAACRPGYETNRAGPSANLNPTAAVDPNVNVFFVVDRSVDSRVEDFGDHKSRMSGIRSDVRALVDEFPHARFAVISFSAKASLDWPLSDDAWSLKSFVKGLSPYTLVTANAVFEVNASAARNLLRDKVDEAAQAFHGSKSVVFYLGGGGGGSRVAPTPFDGIRAKVAGGAVLGYGTAEGGLVPQGWIDGTKAYQTDPGGDEPMRSSLDQPRLKDIAVELNVPYFHREGGQQINGVVPVLDRGTGDQGEGNQLRSQMIERQELYWLFTLLAAALLLADLVASIREYRRNRLSRRDIT